MANARALRALRNSPAQLPVGKARAHWVWDAINGEPERLVGAHRPVADGDGSSFVRLGAERNGQWSNNTPEQTPNKGCLGGLRRVEWHVSAAAETEVKAVCR